MRILWIGMSPATGSAGDEIFDLKTISAVRALGHSIDLFHPRRVAKPREAANLLMGVPHPRTRYASNDNLTRLREQSAGYDLVISSGEAFDRLALQLSAPVLVILHNVISRSLPVLYPGNLPVALLTERTRLWERRNYRQGDSLRAIGVLSRRDQACIQSLKASPEVIYLPPGMPKVTELASDAPLLPELTILGTFDWVPKRRDVIRFAEEYAGGGEQLTVRADRLPPEADLLLKPLPAPTPIEAAAAVRYGIITDRFESGHKLKTSAYIATNNIVISFADVSFDFDHIPDHDLFIRRVNSFEEMRAHMREIEALPWDLVRQRFITFRNRCAASLTWVAVADRLMQTAERIVSSPVMGNAGDRYVRKGAA